MFYPGLPMVRSAFASTSSVAMPELSPVVPVSTLMLHRLESQNLYNFTTYLLQIAYEMAGFVQLNTALLFNSSLPPRVTIYNYNKALYYACV